MNVVFAAINALTLGFACVGTPWLLARLMFQRADGITTIGLAGCLSIALNALAPVCLHLAHVPIVAPALRALHAALAGGVLLTWFLARRARGCAAESTLWPGAERGFIWLLIAFAVLVVPITHLAGIDTYKWQGLAKSVRVEQHIPWLVHPLSLLGFTPRAYPSAQPLLLASVQILGGLGVGAGFYVVSILSGWTGVSLAWCLGRRIFTVPRHMFWFTLFYVFSPVFMRYNHWATGRGLFLSLYPLFVLAILEFPRARAFVLLPVAALFLALAHKTGLVAIALLLMSLPAGVLLPRTGARVWPLILSLPFAALGVILAAPALLPGLVGHLAGFMRTAITRFGWMLPGAAFGLLLSRGWLQDPRRRRLYVAFLITLPFAFTPDPYGALAALPFITFAATVGFACLRDLAPRLARPAATTILILTAAAALVIVGQRDRDAMTARVWRAALALERLDPLGPFAVFAPGRARAQFHAYTSGCPRFLVVPTADATIVFRPPPPIHGDLAKLVPAWIDFFRNLVSLSDVDTDWYGINPRAYYVVIDGEGERPQPADVLYAAENIQILKPHDQPLPPPNMP